MKNIKLSAPDCKYGYPRLQIESMLGQNITAFNKWMCGQTGSICDGLEYSHRDKVYYDTGCGPHGMVYYTSDVRRFILGLPVLD